VNKASFPADELDEFQEWSNVPGAALRMLVFWDRCVMVRARNPLVVLLPFDFNPHRFYVRIRVVIPAPDLF
jgi:hypothetical protein